MKALKWALGAAAALALLAVVAAAIVAATFDPNRYKPEIVRLVQEKTGRTLTMDGPIALTFLPRFGAHVERVTLSGPRGEGVFARIEDARVAVALLPLLSHRVVVDRLSLNGLAVDLARFKDGRTNFDDLIGRGAAPGAKPAEEPPAPPDSSAPLALDIGGIALRDAAIGWRDEGAGTELKLANVDLETGRIASGVPGRLRLAAKIDGRQPAAAVQVDASTDYRIDFASGAIALSSLDLAVRGDAAGLAGLDARLQGERLDIDPAATRIDLAGVELSARSRDGLDARFAVPKLQLAPDRAESEAISGQVKLAQAGRRIDAKLALSALDAKARTITFARFDLDLDARTGDIAVQGRLGTPVALDLEASRAQLEAITGELVISGPNVPNKSVKTALKGDARADWAKRSARAAAAARVDESNVQAVLAVANWARPSLSFDLGIDRLDVDRYLPPKPAGAPAGGQAKAPAGGAAHEPSGRSTAPAPEQPIDLSALKPLDATGTVKVGALQVAGVKAAGVHVGLKAAGGRLDLSPLAANLYQGAMAGSAVVNANNNSFALRQQLTGVSVGPLLRDLLRKDLLEGRGNVALDVTAVGTTPTALKRALNGNASLALRDGAIKGVDVAGTIRKARALLGSQRALEQQAQGGARTDFTELTATFAIRNGVARSDDLQAKSPLVRLAGAGDIDIGNGTMDYVVKAAVVATSTGQGGKDAADVRGITAPVRIRGPFDALTYTVDVAALATDAAKDALARELERRLGGGQAGQGSASGDRPRLEDALRGLLKR